MSCQCDPAIACGCCEGPRILTPRDNANRPGLSALSVRIGTHGSFLETMLARLASQSFPALRDLTTRQRDDAAIAFLDAAAAALDVLTFYAERIANEGYLRTATERRSVLELARLVGYRPRPGVAASVFLSFTLDPGAALEIPRGQPARSIPAPGGTDLPQTFETSHALKARAELNRLRPRMSLPQEITPENVANLETLWLQGAALNLRANDVLLFTFSEEPDIKALRRIASAKPDFENQRTAVVLQLMTLSTRFFVREMRAALRSVRDQAAFAFATNIPPRNAVRDLSSLMAPLLDQLTFDKPLVELDDTLRSKLVADQGPLTSKTFSELSSLVSLIAQGFTAAHTTADAFLSEVTKLRANLRTVLEEYAADDKLVAEVSALSEPPATSGSAAAQLLAASNAVRAQVEQVKALNPKLNTTSLRTAFDKLANEWNAAAGKALLATLRGDYGTAKIAFDQSTDATLTPQLLLLIEGLLKVADDMPLQAVTDRLFATGPLDSKPTLVDLEGLAASDFKLRISELIKALTERFSRTVVALQNNATLPAANGAAEPVLDDERSAITTALVAINTLIAATPVLPADAVTLSTQIESVLAARKTATKLSDPFNLLDTSTGKVLEVLAKTKNEFVSRVQNYPSGTFETLFLSGEQLARDMVTLLGQLNADISPTAAEKGAASELERRKLRALALLLNTPIRTLTEKIRVAPTSLVSALRRIVGHLRNLRFQVNNLPDISEGAAGTEVSAGQGGLTGLLRDLRSSKSALLGEPLSITRDLRALFAADGQKASDSVAQISARLGGGSSGDLFDAWRKIRSGTSDVTIYTFRQKAAVFGYNAGIGLETTDATGAIDLNARFGSPLGVADWDPIEGDIGNEMFLDSEYSAVLPGSYMMVQRLNSEEAFGVKTAVTAPRTVYGLTSKSTHLTLEADAEWARRLPGNPFAVIRQTVVHVQSEKLSLAEQPVTRHVGLPELVGATMTATSDPADGVLANPLAENETTLTLDGLIEGIEPGRWLIISGKRSDGVSGAVFKEVALVQNVDHVLLPSLHDPAIPLAGDTPNTRIVLSEPLNFSYQRETVEIFGNVIDATHGETRAEVLGNGDGRIPFQTFDIKQPPITFTAAPTVAGAESTLQVRVNDVLWHEAESFDGLEPQARRFITETGDDGKTRVVFGSGREGARLPTGSENVKALYRNGLGKPGNVKAGAISQLATKPLGLKEVINPLRASGGAERDTREQMRRNAPLATLALQRLVSVRDYEDFAHTFAGIDKASAVRLSDAAGRFVHVTVAGVDDIPIDTESDLFKNIVATIEQVGDPDVRRQVEPRELVLLVLVAKVRVLDDYLWEKVESKLRAALLEAFGFERRALGQDVFLSEVLSAMQAVEGVDYVDVDSFGGIPEKQAKQPPPAAPPPPPLPKLPEPPRAFDGRGSLSPQEIAQRIEAIRTTTPLPQTVGASLAGHEPPRPVALPANEVWMPPELTGAPQAGGWLRPAQLAIFSPEVADTLILQQTQP